MGNAPGPFGGYAVDIACKMRLVWPRIKPGMGYDTDDWTRGRLSVIINLIMRPSGLYKIDPSDRGKNRTGSRAGYVWDESTGRHGFEESNGTIRPVVFFNPDNRSTVAMMKNDLVGKILADERSTWCGFVTRFASGIGIPKASKGSEYTIGALYNWQKLLEGITDAHSFQAQLTRTGTWGADATSGFNFAVVTGMPDISKLKGLEFSGSDINLAFIVSAKALKEMSKGPIYFKLAQKFAKGAERLEAAEKNMMIELVQRIAGHGQRVGGGVSAAAAGHSIQLSYIDIGLVTGAAASYTNWTGKVISVDRG
ncbi:hypothetical protein [Roseibium album]|nr:hypothetical protein [Roseibium album]